MHKGADNMTEGGEIRMSVKEAKRVGVIQRVIEKSIKQTKAGEILGVSARQIRRIAERYKVFGERGLIHRLRGKTSGRLSKNKAKILKIYEKRYHDFGPLLASEKLFEIEKIKISDETLRKWLLGESKEHEWCRKKRPHRKWRERKEHFGEMIQVDGSEHDWLEGRGSEMTLMGHVDDATGEVMARFSEFEGSLPAMEVMYRHINKYGIPLSVYSDKHSTYKNNNAKQTTQEQLNDQEALTQYERALKELGIKVIHANSPQAKGRIENRFKTFQDRLIKEMRLRNICNRDDANKFLEEYLPKFNKKFSVPAKSGVDLHRPAPFDCVLKSTLCVKTERALKKDSTVRNKGKVYLITSYIGSRVSKVDLEERIDGSIWIKHKDRYLKYKEVEPSVKISEEKLKLGKKSIKWRKYNKNSRPKREHPWRTYKQTGYHIDITDFDDTRDEAITADLARMA
jgi:hypothetical protein